MPPWKELPNVSSINSEELYVTYSSTWQITQTSDVVDNLVTASRNFSFNRELEEDELEIFINWLHQETNSIISAHDTDINQLHLVDSNNYFFYTDLDLDGE